MKKKRIMALIMGTVVTVMSLYGCGGETASGAKYDAVSGHSPADGGAVLEVQTQLSDSMERSYDTAATAEEMKEAPDASIVTTGEIENASASMAACDTAWEMPVESTVGMNAEEYSAISESGFQSVAAAPLSTFSADVDTAAYSNLRRMIETGYALEDIPEGVVRIEELLNYFSYDYKLPQGAEPFGVTTVMSDCPWNRDAKLLQIGLKTQEIDFSEAPASNLVFLLDVSGSMADDNKLPLLQRSFGMLTEKLTEKDRVSIVTYASGDSVALDGARGDEKEKITAALDALMAGGATNGSAGIQTAYALAEKHFIEGGNNRIILATDGDLNVGASSESALKELVTRKKESGVFLTVLGFGMGNIKDNKMETLADYGNGNYAYIDSLSEAKKVLVEEMGATLVTVAKDVKLQVEFNPAYVKGYRLLGYENRALTAEEFDDDKKDAGEIGAGHTVTALYEIIPVDSAQEVAQADLKYQQNASAGVKNGEWLNLKIRYKEPDGEESKLCAYPVTEAAYTKAPSEDFYFAAAVAEFGLLVRDSAYKKDASFENVRALLGKVDTEADEYKDEFQYLVKKLQRTAE
ncbi:MAG: VWA domain-containing protein [Roseburia sp.]|nr:VWA domain-containing protein [Roseburia sp.]